MQNIRMKVPEEIKTKLDEMNLLDRFLFNETVEDVDAYNDMVEILMDGHVCMLPWTETEKELRISPEIRGVRLDVIGMDIKRVVYQTEMQKNNTYNIPKRSRCYQGQIDVSLLEPGSVNFNELNDLTMILVAPFDIFGYGLYRYTFEEYCQEVPGLKLNDGARRIFINTNGTNPEDFSREFLDFMEYINASTDAVAAKSESKRIQRIHERVQTVKCSEKIGVKLMQKWEEMIYEKQEARAEGLAEGRAEGLAEGRALTLLNQTSKKLAKGKTVEEIADALEESVETIEKIIRENNLQKV